MKTLWKKLSILSRYYFVSMVCFLFCWLIFSLLNFQFLNFIFFLMGYVWHFALLTPGIKDQLFSKDQRLSFLNIVVRINYYLQIFISTDKIPFKAPIVRAISPLLFSFLLMVFTGNGNILFTLLGSLAFELSNLLLQKLNSSPSTISTLPSDQETPPAIPPVETSRE